MKLKKVLSGVIAAAMAVTTVAITPILSSAEIIVLGENVVDTGTELGTKTGLGSVDWSGTVKIDADDLSDYPVGTVVEVDIMTTGDDGGQVYIVDGSDWGANATWYNNPGATVYVELTQAMKENGIMFNGSDVNISKVSFLNFTQYTKIKTFSDLGSVDWSGTVKVEASELSDIPVGAILKVGIKTTGDDGGQVYIVDGSDWDASATWYNNPGADVLIEFTADMQSNGIMCNGGDVDIESITAWILEDETEETVESEETSTETEEPTVPSETEEPTKPSETEEPTKPSETEEPTKPGETEEPTTPGETEEPTASDVLWEGNTDLGTEWNGDLAVKVDAAAVSANDIIKITYTAGSADYHQLKIMDSSWNILASLDGIAHAEYGTVDVNGEPYTVTLNAADAAAITASGLVIAGYDVTITKVERVAGTATAPNGTYETGKFETVKDYVPAETPAEGTKTELLVNSISKADAAKYSHYDVTITVTLNDGTKKTATKSVYDCYGGFSYNNGARVEMAENSFFLLVKVKGVPEDATVAMSIQGIV